MIQSVDSQSFLQVFLASLHAELHRQQTLADEINKDAFPTITDGEGG